jgi:membrane protease YdiL (CAAX protease family)
MTMLGALTRGPAAYVPRSGWPAWAVLPAAVGIFVLAAVIGAGAMLLYGWLSGSAVLEQVAGEHSPQMLVQLAVWALGLQVGTIALTLLAAGLFSSQRADALALRPPAPGWRVLPLALLPLFVGTALWTGILLQWQPTVVFQDLRPFQELLYSEAVWVIVPVICLGAPLSEELLFRGFLFSALAKTRLGLVGTSILTALLWTTLHVGYSIFGLIEVLGIGLYLSWVLVRTGSLWVTIFCHGVYNTVVVVALLLVALPAAG